MVLFADRSSTIWFEFIPVMTPKRPLTLTTDVRIAADQSIRPLSKAQQTFNTLIQKINQNRQCLAEWETILPEFHRKWQKDFLPAYQKIDRLRVEWLFCMDSVIDQKGLSQNERDQLRELICEHSARLLEDSEDEQLKDLYQKHSGSDFDEEEAEFMADLKARIQDDLDIDLSEAAHIDNPEDMLRWMQQKAAEQDEKSAHGNTEYASYAGSKKSARQFAQEAKAAAEMKLPLREIYRKLASILHPDRETDEQSRAQKTLLMQRVNDAYSSNNLLQLLEIQLQVEHIDQSTINALTDERLKQYNKILREQLKELETEILHRQHTTMDQLQSHAHSFLTPKNLIRQLAEKINLTKRRAELIKQELTVFQDIKQVRLWLKMMRQTRYMDD
jgi:hypothetical protein